MQLLGPPQLVARLVRSLAIAAVPTLLWTIGACESEQPPRLVYVCPENHRCDPTQPAVTPPEPPPRPSYDGGGRPEPTPLPAPAGASIRPLDFGVVDAVQSTRTGELVVVSDTRELVTIEPSTGLETRLSLPSLPVALGISHDGLLAAVAFDANVSVFDLETRELVTTCPTVSSVQKVAIDDDGLVYLLSGITDYRVDELTRIDAHDCTASTLQRPLGNTGALALSPTGRTLFYQSSALQRCALPPRDAPNGPFVCHELELAGQVDRCPGLWLDRSASILLTGCGARLRLTDEATGSPLPSQDGSISQVGRITSIAVASERERILLVAHAPVDATPHDLGALHIHDGTTLERIDTLGLPALPNGTVNTPVVGRFVFADADQRHAFVFVETLTHDDTPGRFGLATLPLRDESVLDAGTTDADVSDADASDAHD